VVDDYLNTNPEVKDLPGLGIELQSPSPQLVVIAMSYNDPIKACSKILQTADE